MFPLTASRTLPLPGPRRLHGTGGREGVVDGVGEDGVGVDVAGVAGVHVGVTPAVGVGVGGGVNGVGVGVATTGRGVGVFVGVGKGVYA